MFTACRSIAGTLLISREVSDTILDVDWTTKQQINKRLNFP